MASFVDSPTAVKPSRGDRTACMERIFAETSIEDAERIRFLQKEINEKEYAFLELCRDNSGDVLEPEQFLKLTDRRRVLRDQSFEIADKLEQAGIDPFTPDSYGLFKVGVCSENWERLPNFRKTNLIPSVAAQNRSKILLHVQYWIERHPFARMWTVTTGERCTQKELRKRLRWLHRRISKLNKKPWMKKSGIEIVLRCSEVGTIEYNEQGDNPTFHPHAHCIVEVRNKLPKPEWTEVLTKARAFIGHHFDDSGVIGKHREVCKYMFKPSDLCQMKPDDLAEFFYATRRLHIVQPTGSLKAQLATFKDNKWKLTRHITEEGRKWKIIPDPNAHKKKSVEEKIAEKRLDENESQLDEDGTMAPEKNQIFARLLPAHHFGPISEPAILVFNFDGDIKKLLARPEVAQMKLFAGDNYQSGESISDSIYVHNTPLTGRTGRRKKEAPVGNLPSFIGDRRPKEPPDRVAPQNFHEKRQSVSGLPSLIGTGTRPVSKSYAI